MFRSTQLTLTITAVLVVIASSGWLLWQQLDPRLEDATFITIPAADAINEDNTVLNNTAAVTVTEPVVGADELNKPIEADQTDNTALQINSGTITVSAKTTETTTTTSALTNTSVDTKVAVPSVHVSVLGPTVNMQCAVAIIKATTVHAVMQQASRDCNFSYSGKKQGALGFFVETIAGLEQNKAAGYYWVFLVNGAKSQLGVSARLVEPGDSIQWNYEAEY